MNTSVSQEVAPDLSGLDNLDSNPLYAALKLALGSLALKDFDEAQKIGVMAREAVLAQAQQANTKPGHIRPAALLNAEEFAALQRFYECALDGEGYDVPDAMMRRLAEIGVIRRRSGTYYLTTDFGDALLTGADQIAFVNDANQPLQPAGWLYINDDGIGPFYTAEARYADRYLHNWEVFKKAPADGHVCDYKGGYGVCTQCEALSLATSAVPPAAATDSQHI